MSSTNFSRPSVSVPSQNNDVSSRSKSPTSPPYHHQTRHVRQHSQGFFEPSLPSASHANSSMSNLTASQIAAQAAMQQQSSQHQVPQTQPQQQQQQQQQHNRKRSQTAPSPEGTPEAPPTGRRKQKSPPTLHITAGAETAPKSEHPPAPHALAAALRNGSNSAAATAASAAYPRSAISSPGFTRPESPVPPVPDKDAKQKSERSKMKLFSKPKGIGISRDKEFDKRDRGAPSPKKTASFGTGPLPRMVNASTTSLADTYNSSSASLYQTANNSSATLVPTSDKSYPAEKHKHHFLSRQKHKLKDKDDHHHLQLSSAASNSRPLDPSAPQSLYSFAPASPSAATGTFSKSVSGLDLRHGGRALREKKREEKASAANVFPPTFERRDAEQNFGVYDLTTPPAMSVTGSSHGPPTGGSLTYFNESSNHVDAPSQSALQGFGLVGMTPDDAWPFLKAKLLVVFEGASIRFPVEDLNRLVSVHIKRSVQKRAPSIVIEDVRDLLDTGFSSLSHTLRSVSDGALVPRLVEMWLDVFGVILPYIQAVLLPLDLEFRGLGSIMSSREAQEFWGGMSKGDSVSPLGEALDVRRFVLTSFRDNVILPRHHTLKTIFSRLTLDNINGLTISPRKSSSTDRGSAGRPGTSGGLDPALASFNSQGSTLLNDSGSSSLAGLGGRSRTTSNTSSAFGSNSGVGPAVSSVGSALNDQTSSPPPSQAYRTNTANTTPTAPRLTGPQILTVPNTRIEDMSDSNLLTERVGRMLQCISVLASLQPPGPSKVNDEAQQKMEELAKTLKHNWLGRGRTGRNRRGFVGTRQPRTPTTPMQQQHLQAPRGVVFG